MKDILQYKGFIGSVHFSADDEVFFGKIEGINDLVTFEGSSVKELTDAFHFVVDEHIKDCERENIEAEKSYRGSFNVRISPELHRRIATSAKTRGLSINKYINEVLLKNVNV
ncbi:MAG: type II toxin-antitoxin system HicB family antitoxin [Prolixibacteraceae bacterium]|nr:type II toxin-antitoxin system HicB family antitoxin [Prolixibacteraceae bacterium]